MNHLIKDIMKLDKSHRTLSKENIILREKIKEQNEELKNLLEMNVIDDNGVDLMNLMHDNQLHIESVEFRDSCKLITPLTNKVILEKLLIQNKISADINPNIATICVIGHGFKNDNSIFY